MSNFPACLDDNVAQLILSDGKILVCTRDLKAIPTKKIGEITSQKQTGVLPVFVFNTGDVEMINVKNIKRIDVV